MQKKVLLVVTKSNFGGAQRYVYDLATSLPQEQYAVSVAFGGTGLPGAGAGDLHVLLSKAGIRTLFIKNFARDIFFLKDLFALFELVAIFKKEKPDIVHLNSSKAGGLGALAARLSGIHTIVYTAHGWPHREPRSVVAKSLIYLFSWFTVLLSTHTITVSGTDLKDTPSLFKKRSLVRVHNGIDLKTPLLEKETARKKLQEKTTPSIPNSAWVVTIAELTRNKNLESLIQALVNVKDAVLISIGRGELETTLKELTKKLGIEDRVFFLGFVPNADHYLKAADVFVLPSFKEGLPYTLLEAGHAQLPVVASNTGGIPEIIEHEKNGLLIDPKNIQEIEMALNTLISSPEKRALFGEALQEKVATHFSKERMVQETIKVYER